MKKTFELIDTVLRRNGIPAEVPLYEHGFDDGVAAKIMGWEPMVIDPKSFDQKFALWKRRLEFFRQMGFCYMTMELPPKFARIQRIEAEDSSVNGTGTRMWADETSGTIKTMEDLGNPDYWPAPENALDYRMFESVSALVPEGMKVIGGVSGGIFEYGTALAGLVDLSIKIYDDEEFADRLFEQIGKTFVAIAERLLKIPNLGALRIGDDLGFKNGTFFSPEILRKYVFPWHKKLAEMAHDAGKTFVLHSCGNLEGIMDDLIDDVKIDAKHSFEDVIMPVTEAKRRWGHRVALLGGLDVDYLARHTPAEIMEYTKRTLDVCAEGGGFAIGSGNSVTNYIPAENYLAVVRATEEFNGR